jgi:hypothetical protein
MPDPAGTPTAHDAWRTELARQLEDLNRWFEGRLALAPNESVKAVPAERFFDVDYLREVIARARSPHMTSGDEFTSLPKGAQAQAAARLDGNLGMQIAASRFTRHYAAPLTTVALVGLARGVGIDVSPSRCVMIFRNNIPFQVMLDPGYGGDEVMRCSERPTSLQVTGPQVETLEQLREFVWSRLYGEHLRPLYERVVEITKISSTLAWTNAAEWVGMVSDAAAEYLGAAAPFSAESSALFEVERLPGFGDVSNPLRGKIDRIPMDGHPSGVLTRGVCCLCYLLEDRFGRLCADCPHLPIEDRVALTRERHGVPMGAPGGEAERRAIEHGLARSSLRRLRGPAG